MANVNTKDIIDWVKNAVEKKMIKEFRRNICTFLEKGVKKEVYRLNVQFFPIKK